VANKRVQTEMWAFDLPLWAYVLVGFCPMGFCSVLWAFVLHSMSADRRRMPGEVFTFSVWL